MFFSYQIQNTASTGKKINSIPDETRTMWHLAVIISCEIVIFFSIFCRWLCAVTLILCVLVQYQ